MNAKLLVTIIAIVVAISTVIVFTVTGGDKNNDGILDAFTMEGALTCPDCKWDDSISVAIALSTYPSFQFEVRAEWQYAAWFLVDGVVYEVLNGAAKDADGNHYIGEGEEITLLGEHGDFPDELILFKAKAGDRAQQVRCDATQVSKSTFEESFSTAVGADGDSAVVKTVYGDITMNFVDGIPSTMHAAYVPPQGTVSGDTTAEVIFTVDSFETNFNSVAEGADWDDRTCGVSLDDAAAARRELREEKNSKYASIEDPKERARVLIADGQEMDLENHRRAEEYTRQRKLAESTEQDRELFLADMWTGLTDAVSDAADWASDVASTGLNYVTGHVIDNDFYSIKAGTTNDAGDVVVRPNIVDYELLHVALGVYATLGDDDTPYGICYKSKSGSGDDTSVYQGTYLEDSSHAWNQNSWKLVARGGYHFPDGTPSEDVKAIFDSAFAALDIEKDDSSTMHSTICINESKGNCAFSWRGSTIAENWINNINLEKVELPGKNAGTVRGVHTGFLTEMNAGRNAINVYGNYNSAYLGMTLGDIWVDTGFQAKCTRRFYTGHSLGGASAIIAAYVFEGAHDRHFTDGTGQAVTFAAPQPWFESDIDGGAYDTFNNRRYYSKHGLGDPVPMLPADISGFVMKLFDALEWLSDALASVINAVCGCYSTSLYDRVKTALRDNDIYLTEAVDDGYGHCDQPLAMDSSWMEVETGSNSRRTCNRWVDDHCCWYCVFCGSRCASWHYYSEPTYTKGYVNLIYKKQTPKSNSNEWRTAGGGADPFKHLSGHYTEMMEYPIQSW